MSSKVKDLQSLVQQQQRYKLVFRSCREKRGLYSEETQIKGPKKKKGIGNS